MNKIKIATLFATFALISGCAYPPASVAQQPGQSVRSWSKPVWEYPLGYRGAGYYAGQWFPGGVAGYNPDDPHQPPPPPGKWAHHVWEYPFGYRGPGYYANEWWGGGYAGYQ